jgi:hypothetical protein
MGTTNTTITVNGVEHGLWAYDDDTGHGLTYCRKQVGPYDLGPNHGEINCADCKTKIEHIEKQRSHN